MILDTIKRIFSSAPRPRAVTVASAQFEPQSMIEWADVDRVGMSLRSAQGGLVQPLFALYRDIVLTDAHVQTELSKRKLAVLGDTFRVLPYDRTSADDRAAAQFVESAIYACRDWRGACSALLDSVLWPVSLVEKVYAPAGSGYQLAGLVPVPPYLLDYSRGQLAIRATTPDGTPENELLAPDPDRYITHRGHLLTTPDQFGGPMRALVYWWLASSCTRDWWVRFLARYGTPFLAFKYDPTLDGERELVKRAIQSANSLAGVAVSRSTEIQLIEASRSGADVFERFMEIAQREKSKLILGQTLSSTPSPTGEIGSGTASLQSDVRDDIRRLDAQMLADTLRDQLFIQLCAINRLPGRAPYIVWGAASTAELRAKADLLGSLRNAGLEIDDPSIEPLSDEIGFGLRRAPATTPAGPSLFSAAREVGADRVFFRREHGQLP